MTNPGADDCTGWSPSRHKCSAMHWTHWTVREHHFPDATATCPASGQICVMIRRIGVFRQNADIASDDMGVRRGAPQKTVTYSLSQWSMGHVTERLRSGSNRILAIKQFVATRRKQATHATDLLAVMLYKGTRRSTEQRADDIHHCRTLLLRTA